MSKLPAPLSYTAPAMARRVKRNPGPGDLALAQLAEKQATLIAQIAALRTVVVTPEFHAVANIIASRFSPTDASSPSYGDTTVSYWLYRSGYVRWEDPALLALIKDFEAIDPDHSTLKENRDYFSRDYEWEWHFAGDLKITVHLTAYENKDTSECRRVQVGTKVVETPVYKYDCVIPEGTTPLPPPTIDTDLLA